MGAEYMHPEGPEGLLTDCSVIVGKSSHNKIYQLVFSFIRGFLRLFTAKKSTINMVVFYYHPKGMQYCSRHLSVGCIKELFQIQNELVQLSWRQMKHYHSQVIGNVF